MQFHPDNSSVDGHLSWSQTEPERARGSGMSPGIDLSQIPEARVVFYAQTHGFMARCRLDLKERRHCA